MPAEPISNRAWRRFLRFSVRGLIVAVLVIGAGLGWAVRSAQVQRDAVAAIQKAGGLVAYDWEAAENRFHGGIPWAPPWLVNMLGVDYFGRVVGVIFFVDASDAELVYVGRLSSLVDLRITGRSVTDAGLLELRNLVSLRILGLADTKVTDPGLAHLERMSNLSELDLQGTQVTDAGLVNLKRLTKLSFLGLGGAAVSDAGLGRFLPCFSDDSGICGTQVTDAGENELQRALPNLKIYR